VPLVADIVERDLLVVAPDLPLLETARQMVARNVGAALVLDEGALAGIFTERDLLRAVGEGHEDKAVVADWMTRHPETIEASETTDQAAVLMIHGGFRHLPVLEEGSVVGIVSIRDLVRVTLVDTAPRGA
jgi:CBS domain-containing protein